MKMLRLVVALFAVVAASHAAKPNRPHVILIMTDDQGGWDYGFAGNPVVKTPHIDNMARTGAHMSRFYVSPVCTPTRANLMTGRYNYRTRAIDTYIGRAMMDPEEVTIAEVLGAAGYATGIFGKWHLGDSYPMRPQDQGFDEVLVHRGGGIGQPSDPPGGEGKYTDPILQHNGEEKTYRGYCTDVYFDNAISFLRKQHQAGKPAFIYLPMNAPHGPFDDVPEDLLKKYKGTNLRGTFPKGFPERQFKRHEDRTARIFAMEENVDDNVGKLFSSLKTLGASENTLVLFLNDNGPNGPRFVGPHRGSKASIYEGGIRSPLLAVWPRKIPAGTKSDLLSAHYDVLPTILEAAGVKKPAGLKLDGVSILAAMRGAKVERSNRGIFLQWHRGDYPVPYRNGAIVTERYKLLWPNYSGEIPPKNHAPQLFDLKADPKEQNNLATSKPDILKRLKKRYDIWFSDVSATRPNNYDPPRIRIGNPKERMTVLTRQDWRYRGPLGKGWTSDARGHWLVTVEKRARYDVRIIFSEHQQAGQLTLQIGKVKRTSEVTANGGEVRFKGLPLAPGPQQVDAFLKHGDRQRGVHQIYINPAS